MAPTVLEAARPAIPPLPAGRSYPIVFSPQSAQSALSSAVQDLAHDYQSRMTTAIASIHQTTWQHAIQDQMTAIYGEELGLRTSGGSLSREWHNNGCDCEFCR